MQVLQNKSCNCCDGTLVFVIVKNCYRRGVWQCTLDCVLGHASTEQGMENRFVQSKKSLMVKLPNCWRNLEEKWTSVLKKCNSNEQDTIEILSARFEQRLANMLFQVNCIAIVMQLVLPNRVILQRWLSCMQMMELSKDRKFGRMSIVETLEKP